MDIVENRLKEYGRTLKYGEIPEAEIEWTIRRGKEAFYDENERQTLSRWEFMAGQAGYIRWRWWVFQGLLLLVLWMYLYFTESDIYMQRSMGVFSSLFAVMIIPELWRNQSTQAMEVEGCAYFSLRRIYAARIFAFGMVDLTLLSIFGGVVSLTVQVTLYEMLIQFVLPFCVTCCICFRTLTGKYWNSEYMAIFLSLLWTAIWMLLLMREDLYRQIAKPVWLLILSLAVCGFMLSVRGVIGKCSRIWEEKRQWS